MPNRVKIVIVNATDFAFTRTHAKDPETGEPDPNILATDDFVMNVGNLDPGSGLPPSRIEPGASCNFELQSPIGGPGPDGRFRYEFETLKMRVSINWTDATQTQAGKAQNIDVPDPNNPDGPPVQEKGVAGAVDPFSIDWTLLNGGIGDLDPAPVVITDDTGKTINFDQLASWHQRDAAEQGKKDTNGNYIGVPKLLTAKFTLKVKNAKSTAAVPAVVPAVMPPGVVRPTGGSKAVVGTPFHTWDADGISPRRKKLLAVIGNLFPQLYDRPMGSVEPYKKVPNQPMICWRPGTGTTSCTSVNGMVEAILTGAKISKWAFAAFHLEEAWVPWGGNPSKTMPNVGDVYILYSDVVNIPGTDVNDTPHERHCGFIVRVPEKPGDDWITADGGQKASAALLNRRPWELRAPSQPDDARKKAWDKAMVAHTFARPIAGTEYPYLGGGAEAEKGLTSAPRLIGWLDMDHPSIVFKDPESFDTPREIDQKFRQKEKYTEYDYQFLGAWIDDLIDRRPNALAGWLAHLKDAANNPPPWQPAAPPST